MPGLSNSTTASAPVLLVALLRSWCLFSVLVTFAVPAFASQVTLGWDPNSETNISGYGVYYKRIADGPPYELYGYVTIEELSDDQAPTFTVAGLEKGVRYWFAVTAYNTLGNESGFSNSVCSEILDTVKPCADPIDPGPDQLQPDVPDPVDPGSPITEPGEPPLNPPDPVEPGPDDSDISDPLPSDPEPAEPEPVDPPPGEPIPRGTAVPPDPPEGDPASREWNWERLFEFIWMKLMEFFGLSLKQ
jgi:hypothetical protein